MSDVRRVFTVQAIRAFLYGFSSILIGASLAATGSGSVADNLAYWAGYRQGGVSVNAAADTSEECRSSRQPEGGPGR